MPAGTSHPLTETARAFAALGKAERIEALVEYGRFVRDLPPAYRTLRDAGVGIVTECASPVFIIGEAESGLLRIRADAPREAPVARGFVGLLVHAYDGKPLDLLRSAPDGILDELHLTTILSMRRVRGLNGIYRQLRIAVSAPVAAEAGRP